MNILKLLQQVIVTGAMLLAAPAFAHAAAATNAAPLGLEIGKATAADVARLVPKPERAGTNRYSGGAQWQTDGNEAGLEGLKRVDYLFDRSNVLVAVEMTFSKNPKGMMKLFSGKYKLVSNKVDDFMNYGSARYEKGDTYIDINAPHMSFDMTVTYATKALMKSFKQTVSDTEQEKKNKAQQAL
ncbi:MAG: hypothetical protein AB1807_10270 [Pseudomonadota bacterium]